MIPTFYCVNICGVLSLPVEQVIVATFGTRISTDWIVIILTRLLRIPLLQLFYALNYVFARCRVLFLVFEVLECESLCM